MNRRDLILIGVTVVSILAIFLVPPIPQPEAYHHFADTRMLAGTPNGLNVWSNLPFVLVGLLGMRILSKRKHPPLFPVLPYGLFFAGLLLTGLGSGYYHWAPSNKTLIWDRLPMTIAFGSLCSAILAQLVNRKLGMYLLFPFILLGIGSVFYWYWSEIQGRGDLRPYAWVQFYPMLAIPLMVFMYPAAKSFRKAIISVIALYALAKVFEGADGGIFRLGQIVSGHTLKHLAAAVSILPITGYLRQHTFSLRGTSSETKVFRKIRT